MPDPAEKDAKERPSLGEVFERAWGQVEKGLEEAVQRSLVRVKAPRREALAECAARIERLAARIAALEEK